jgi:hypothetical protein
VPTLQHTSTTCSTPHPTKPSARVLHYKTLSFLNQAPQGLTRLYLHSLVSQVLCWRAYWPSGWPSCQRASFSSLTTTGTHDPPTAQTRHASTEPVRDHETQTVLMRQQGAADRVTASVTLYALHEYKHALYLALWTPSFQGSEPCRLKPAASFSRVRCCVRRSINAANTLLIMVHHLMRHESPQQGRKAASCAARGLAPARWAGSARS